MFSSDRYFGTSSSTVTKHADIVLSRASDSEWGRLGFKKPPRHSG